MLQKDAPEDEYFIIDHGETSLCAEADVQVKYGQQPFA
jgi:hypothetical protein